MCGRYLLNELEKNELSEIIKDINFKDKSIGEIFPTNKVPVIIKNSKISLTIDSFLWSFPHFKDSGVIINARCESILEKDFFRDSFLENRCIIPSNGFYEWKKTSLPKEKYLFNLPDSDCLYMAGIYNEFNGEKRFVIVTTNANDSISDIHDRMPLIIPKNMIKNWIFNTKIASNLLMSTPPKLQRKLI